MKLARESSDKFMVFSISWAEDPLCTEAALQEAAGAGRQGSMVSGSHSSSSHWPYHHIRSFHMKAPACDTVLHHPYIAENAMELQ